MIRSKLEGWASMLALIVFLSVSAILATTYIYSGLDQKNLALGRKAAQEMVFIQDASKRYYNINSAWPGSLALLQSSGFLPVNHPISNPWGNAYTLSTSGANLVVTTTVPSKYSSSLSAILPSPTVSGSAVNSTVPPPGQEPLYNKYMHKAGDLNTRTMEGNLVMGGNQINNVSDGVDPTDATTLKQARQKYVQVSGDTMTGSLSAPEIDASSFIDANNNAYAINPEGSGGETNVNDVNLQDVFLRKLGWWATQGSDIGNPAGWECYARPLQVNGCCDPGYITLILTGDITTNYTLVDAQCTTGTTSAICCR